jgi:predicted nucleic acid-binding Zn ribbon protein
MRSVEAQPEWRSRRQFQTLVTGWAEVVGPAVAAQTRPLGVQRQVLMVATSSAVWAQTLSFERVRLLEKLNQRLAAQPPRTTLRDIRFSTAQWSAAPVTPESTSDVLATWQCHPSRLPQDAPPPSHQPRCANSQDAFRRWSSTIQSRSQHLPLCPACHCPTPPGELARWSVCALCAAQDWSSRDRLPKG